MFVMKGNKLNIFVNILLFATVTAGAGPGR